jgi:F420-dependent oxidoreductase-like protein
VRIGITMGPSGRAENPIDEMVSAARDAAGRRLTLWMPQLGDVDALTVLAIVGREVPDIDVGTAVVPTYPRHPLVMASQALTVAAASGNRFTLGIGLSHQVLIEGSFGYTFDRPVRHLREYLEVLMPLLHHGEVDYEGELFRVSTTRAVRVAGANPPPVVVAALGPQTLEVAGRLADGTVLWMVGPRTLAEHVVPTINRAAERAGRPRPRVVVGLPVVVTDDPEAAHERAGRSYGFYNDLPSYRAMLDREGVDGPADVAIIGDEAEVTAQLDRLAELGATDVSLSVFGSGSDRARTLALLGSLSAGR